MPICERICQPAIAQEGGRLLDRWMAMWAWDGEVYTFDSLRLTPRLEALTTSAAAVFAAACAERLFTGYEGYVAAGGDGDVAALRTALNALWDHLIIGTPPHDLERLADECLDLVPDMLGGPWSLYGQYAEDAVASSVYALRCGASGDVRYAIDCAERAYESVDAILQYEFDMDPGDPGENRRMVEHPLTQAEFSREDRDLTELTATASYDLAAAAVRLRKRATTEPIHRQVA